MYMVKMMNVVYCYIENNTSAVDQTYTYQFDDEKIEPGMRVWVNFNHRDCVGFVDRVEMNTKQRFPYELKKIIKVLDENPILNQEMMELAKWMAKTSISTVISCLQTMVPAQLKPKTSNSMVVMEKWVRPLQDLTKTEKQRCLYVKLVDACEMKRSEWLKYSLARKLEQLGCVEVFEKEKKSIEENVEKKACRFQLTDEQEKAITSIMKSQKEVICLKGVTGSGKTEVFLHCAEKIMASGRQVLFLVPEISLTPLMVKRVKERFGNDVAIYHSGLNNQQKYEQYQSVKHHEKKIVVGTRSAVFMPFDDLGLIILDEEHDTSYKQDHGCRYHARDVAIKRGETHHAKVILASATPSLDTYARAMKSVYDLVEIKSRVNQQMPHVKLIDMKEVIRNKQSYILSDEMKEAIQKRLEMNQQVILLLNRRGYQPVFRCNGCSEILMCPHCDKPLVYHKQDQSLNCHLCGYHEKKRETCPKCNGKLIGSGFGTQMLAEKVAECFPNARIIRMDADTTSRKDAHEKLLDRFEKHEADILLGTQMIAKGLDFENVTLVGILQGDSLLQRSDYRSGELTFDLLTQASGRSGRGSENGEVLIQVYDTKHYAIQCALNQNYDSFFKHEMRYRHLASYPPYTYLASLMFISRDGDQAYQLAENVMSDLKKKHFKVLGVSELLKIQDQKRYRLIIKSKSRIELQEVVYDLYQQHRRSKSRVKFVIDMNPLTLDE